MSTNGLFTARKTTNLSCKRALWLLSIDQNWQCWSDNCHPYDNEVCTLQINFPHKKLQQLPHGLFLTADVIVMVNTTNILLMFFAMHYVAIYTGLDSSERLLLMLAGQVLNITQQ